MKNQVWQKTIDENGNEKMILIEEYESALIIEEQPTVEVLQQKIEELQTQITEVQEQLISIQNNNENIIF